MNDSKKHIFLIGNPGTGKSTILNGLIGRAQFKSGVSYGKCLFQGMQLYEHSDGITYGDMPPLSDVKIREKAAEMITKALKQNGSYKLIFVVTVEAGRVRPSDVTTINLVLDSIKHPVHYAVILNKVTSRFINDVTSNEQFFHSLLASFNVGEHKTDNFHYFKESDDLKEKDNQIPKLPQELWDFIHKKVSYNVILADNVKDIQLDEFERIKEVFESQIKEIKENAQKREQMFLETIDKLEKQRKEIELQHIAQLEKFEQQQMKVRQKMEQERVEIQKRMEQQRREFEQQMKTANEEQRKKLQKQHDKFNKQMQEAEEKRRRTENENFQLKSEIEKFKKRLQILENK